MSFNEDILQQIEDYLNGSMTDEELVLFEEQIGENKDLAEAISINKKMQLQYGDDDWDFIKDDKNNTAINTLETLLKSDDFNNKKEVIQATSDVYFKRNKQNKLKVKNSKLYYALGIAAAIVVFLGLFLKDNGLSNEEIYLDNSSWQELPSLVSRSETNTILLSKGENAFLKKDYKLAQESFGIYIKNKKELNVNVLLYVGISQLELEDFNAALVSFQKIIDSKTLDQSKGYWYMALTYLKMDDREAAVNTFKIIVNNATYYNHEKAKVILEKLN